MTAYDIFRSVVRLIGSPWGFYPVAVVALYAHGMRGHPLDALPFLLEWMLVVGAFKWLGRRLEPGRVPALPANRPLPPSAQAVSVTPTMPPEESPDLARMKARLPANVGRLLR